jgi:hypothetical protein
LFLADDVALESALAAAGINKSGDSKYALVSKEDVDASQPAGAEYVDIRTADYADTASDPHIAVAVRMPGLRCCSGLRVLWAAGRIDGCGLGMRSRGHFARRTVRLVVLGPTDI